MGNIPKKQELDQREGNVFWFGDNVRRTKLQNI